MKRTHQMTWMLALMAGDPRLEAALAASAPPFNPNDCVTCEHRHEPQGGHCYMFKEPPQRKCGQYRKDDALSFGDEFAERTKGREA